MNLDFPTLQKAEDIINGAKKVMKCRYLERAREALRRASHKLPIKTKFVARRELNG